MDYKTMKTPALFLRYVIPQMIGLVFNSVYFIVDGVFIGRRLGTGALAAAGVAVPVVEVSIAVAMMISVGTGVIISVAAGQGRQAKARQAFNLSAVFTLGVSVLAAVLGVAFATPLARALGAGNAIVQDTSTYLRLYLAFCPFLVFSYALSAYVRNDGRPTLAMAALIVGALSNVLLDWVFMYPMNMGIAGAALATGLGPVFSVMILLPHFLRKKGILYFEKPGFNAATLRDILVGGTPAFVAEFSLGFVTLLYNLAIVKNGLGEDGLAGYVVLGYAALIGLTAFLGAAQGVQPPVSYFTGAGMQQKARSLTRAAVLFCLGVAGLLYAALYFGGGAFYGIFITGDGPLLAQTVQASRLYFINLPFAAVNILLCSVMQAMGNVRSSLVVSLSRSTLPLVLFLQVLPVVLGIPGLWLAITAAEVVTLVLALVLWLRQWQPGAGQPAGRAKQNRQAAKPAGTV